MSIAPLLKKSIKKQIPNKTAPNWRIHKKHFVRKTNRHFCEPGAVTFSSGWFGQGHEVRFDYYWHPELIRMEKRQQNIKFYPL
jgi:hypothetical protein